MARPGLASEQIRQTIEQLAAEGAEPSVTAIRERLGSGSYSTIGAVLTHWRRQQAQAARRAVPEPPDTLPYLVKNLWAEAWKSADAAYEPERQAFQRERAEHEKTRQEMAAEIRRLEEELERVAAEMWPGAPVIPDMETGASDSIYTIAAGIPTYGVSGMAIDQDDVRAHGKDERIRVSAYYDGVEFFYRYLKALVGGGK